MPSTQKGTRKVQSTKHIPQLTNRQKQGTRDIIQVTKIIELLQKNAMGTLTKPHLKNIPDPGAPYELSASQVKSAQILLDKALPSLQAIDVKQTSEVPKMSPDELKQELGKWLRQLPEEEVSRMLRGAPSLTVIEAEVIDGE